MEPWYRKEMPSSRKPKAPTAEERLGGVPYGESEAYKRELREAAERHEHRTFHGILFVLSLVILPTLAVYSYPWQGDGKDATRFALMLPMWGIFSGVVVSQIRPPKSRLPALVYALDGPVIVAIGVMAGQASAGMIFVLDLLVEYIGLGIALVMYQLTGSIDPLAEPAASKPDGRFHATGVGMVISVLFLGTAIMFGITPLQMLWEDGAWMALLATVVGAVWSARVYMKLGKSEATFPVTGIMAGGLLLFASFWTTSFAFILGAPQPDETIDGGAQHENSRPVPGLYPTK